MRDRKPVSLGERWRREANREVDDSRLEQALATLPQVRHPRIRVQRGSIQVEMEGAMGSIHEVSVHAPVLSSKIWPQVARVMRRSTRMLEALEKGRVPRSFDRLVGRIGGESVFPDSRRVTSACSCGAPDAPCRHILALHEMFARRLEEQPWELLVLRGVDLHDLLSRARSSEPDPNLPPLAFGSEEEPVLFPEGEDGDLEFVLSLGQSSHLLGDVPALVDEAAEQALAAYRAAARPEADKTTASEDEGAVPES